MEAPAAVHKKLRVQTILFVLVDLYPATAADDTLPNVEINLYFPEPI